MLIEIPHEVSKAYRHKLQIINRLAVKRISSKEKKSPNYLIIDSWGLFK